MIIDFTAELAPLLWAMLGILLILAGALVASIDPETAEVYVGDGRLLAATVAVATVVLLGLIVARPDFVAALGLPLH